MNWLISKDQVNYDFYLPKKNKEKGTMFSMLGRCRLEGYIQNPAKYGHGHFHTMKPSINRMVSIGTKPPIIAISL